MAPVQLASAAVSADCSTLTEVWAPRRPPAQIPLQSSRSRSPRPESDDDNVIQLPVRPTREASGRRGFEHSVAEGDRHQRVRVLLTDMVACDDPIARKNLQSKVVLEHQGVARSIAARYRGRGVERGDLEQLAYLGLVKAVLRWQPGRSEDFLQFAVPTIAGEIKRYFRDHSFMVRPPRRIQELRAALNAPGEDAGRAESAHRSDAEISEALGVDAESVREARQAVDLCRPRSLDAPGISGQSLSQSWGADDEELNHVEDRLAVEEMLELLTDRERAVVRMRFVEGLSQARIGKEIGVSQMQVSRLLRGIVVKLRGMLAEA